MGMTTMYNRTYYRTVVVNGTKIFYREAGSADAPTLLLLHGFPSSSHMFRDLIPLLAGRLRLVAPDFPGFGQSDMPERQAYEYTFANIASTIAGFTDKIGLKKFAIYIFDYGQTTWRSIPSFRSISGNTSRRCWRYGARMIPSFFLPAQKGSSGTSPRLR